ncbi:15318_t:CDS:2 [Acaulospora colombiana]|uniref:15318_t:CDS:1 n=1 Tax=Acaulospora colombiana TaxID=27376 RepID=A0ACA9MCS9_9GLOM|nr:15318_t:CDS:2 [Acaulospora colombiana]
MGFEMATNLFTKTIVAHSASSNPSAAAINAASEVKVNPITGEELTSDSGSKVRHSETSSKSNPPPAFTVCDVNQDAARAIVSKLKEKFPGYHFQVAKDPADRRTLINTHYDVTIVATSSEKAILPALAKLPNGEPTLVIDSTTLDIDVARDVAKNVEQAGAMMVDAPVSGGGPQPSVTLATPYLSLMGARTIHCGPSGAGLAAKICNNMILGVQQIAVAEGMLLGQRMGLKPDVLAGVLNTSTGRCWSSEVNNPVPEALSQSTAPCTRDYEGGFATALMLKDMNLALHAGESFTTPLILGTAAKEVYENVARQTSLAQKDFSVVYQVLKVAAEAQASKNTSSPEHTTPAGNF